MCRLSFCLGFLSLVVLTLGGYFYFSQHSSARDIPDLLPAQQLSDHILIEKQARKLTLFKEGDVIAIYNVRLGFSPVGHKIREGDGKTPEGLYQIDRRNDRSAFHLSLGLNYPTAAQKAAASEKGIDPGSDIFIHGQPNGLGDSPDLIGGLPYDWTEGCIALSNKDMREIWQHVARGTIVEIRP